MTKFAAGVLVLNADGKVLALRGPKHGGGYDLPFGKVHEGESVAEAAVRECFEETGIVPGMGGLKELYAAEANGFWAVTFMAESYVGELRPSSEGIPEWTDREKLLVGTYGSYNAGVLRRLREISPEMRVHWDSYFMGIARAVATRSTCLRVPDGIGCVLVRDRKILGTGYTGSIRHQPHCTDVGCLIDDGVGCVRTVHAEQNAILQAATPLEGATAYTTLSPCWVCFKLLVNAGVTRIVYGAEYRIIERQKVFAKDCGIDFVFHP